MKTVKLLLPFDFQMVREYDEDITDLSMGLSLEEIIEETVRYNCLNRNIKEWYDYVANSIFYEHVSNDMVLICMNYLEYMTTLVTKMISAYVDRMYNFYTVSNISFDYQDNSIIVEGIIDDGSN